MLNSMAKVSPSEAAKTTELTTKASEPVNSTSSVAPESPAPLDTMISSRIPSRAQRNAEKLIMGSLSTMRTGMRRGLASFPLGDPSVQFII